MNLISISIYCHPRADCFVVSRLIYIYIYIFTNLISTSIHGTEKKTIKNLARNKRKKYLESPSREKRKKILGQKERKGQPRPFQGIRSRWSKENQKTLRESCNATITKVLNTRQWSQL